MRLAYGGIENRAGYRGALRFLGYSLLLNSAVGFQALGDASATSLGRSASELRALAQKKRRLCKLKDALGDVVQGVRLVSAHGPLWNGGGEVLSSMGGRCAVVSSSGVLLRHRHGAEIDAAGKVFRFNSAPTKGFEEFVGARTDLRIVNNKMVGLWTEGEYAELLSPTATVVTSCPVCNVGIFDKVDESDYRNNQLAFTAKFPKGVALFASNLSLELSFDRYLGDVFAYDHASSPAGATTGGVGLALALALCDEVRAYGMADSEGAASADYSYYDHHSTVGKTKHHHHSFDAEKTFWRSLAVNGAADVDGSDVAVIPGFSTCKQ